MITVLNIGLNDESAQGMISLTGNERFVYIHTGAWFRCLVRVLGISDEALNEWTL